MEYGETFFEDCENSIVFYQDGKIIQWIQRGEDETEVPGMDAMEAAMVSETENMEECVTPESVQEHGLYIAIRYHIPGYLSVIDSIYRIEDNERNRGIFNRIG